MGGLSVVHWAIVAIAIMLLFGGGRISRTMGDLGHGIRTFRKEMNDDKTLERLPPLQ